MIDADIQLLLDTVFKVAPTTDEPDVAALRAAAEDAPRRLGGKPESLSRVHDASVQGRAGPIAVRVYRPQPTSELPLVVFAHGGGWVTGSLSSHDKLCRIAANRLPAVVVAVDYRRAPEHVYPAALDDFESVWRWALAQGTSLGADGVRYCVAGDSSGGNLAASLTLRLRESGGRAPDLQLLLYPALDAACSRPSYRQFASGYNLSASQMAWYWNAYRAGSPHGAQELSPLAAKSLAGLAPAVIAIAEQDVLRDDAVDYARRLADDGAAVRVIHCEGMIHGFLRWTGAVPAALRWMDVVAAATRETLADSIHAAPGSIVQAP